MIEFQVAEAAQAQGAHTIAIVGAIGAVSLQSWRNRVAVMDLLDDFKDKNATLVSNLSIRIAEVNANFSNHVTNGPTELENLVRAENDKVVDRVTAVCVEYGERIEKIGSEIQDVRLACVRRHRENGGN